MGSYRVLDAFGCMDTMSLGNYHRLVSGRASNLLCRKPCALREFPTVQVILNHSQSNNWRGWASLSCIQTYPNSPIQNPSHRMTHETTWFLILLSDPLKGIEHCITAKHLFGYEEKLSSEHRGHVVTRSLLHIYPSPPSPHVSIYNTSNKNPRVCLRFVTGIKPPCEPQAKGIELSAHLAKGNSCE